MVGLTYLAKFRGNSELSTDFIICGSRLGASYKKDSNTLGSALESLVGP